MKPKIIKKTLIRLLKSSQQQFYDEDGIPISVEEYVGLCLKQDLKTAMKFQKKIKAETAKKPKKDEKTT